MSIKIPIQMIKPADGGDQEQSAPAEASTAPPAEKPAPKHDFDWSSPPYVATSWESAPQPFGMIQDADAPTDTFGITSESEYDLVAQALKLHFKLPATSMGMMLEKHVLDEVSSNESPSLKEHLAKMAVDDMLHDLRSQLVHMLMAYLPD